MTTKAEELRKISERCKSFKDRQQLDSVNKAISAAAERGDFQVEFSGDISHYVRT